MDRHSSSRTRVDRVDHAARLVLFVAPISWVSLAVAVSAGARPAWLLLSALAGAVAFVAWFARTHANLRALGEGGALGWRPLSAWLVPGVNLALAPSLAAAVWRASHRRAGVPEAPGGLLLPLAGEALGLVTLAAARQGLAVAVVLLGGALVLVVGRYVVTVSRLQGVVWRLTWEERVRVAGETARHEREAVSA